MGARERGHQDQSGAQGGAEQEPGDHIGEPVLARQQPGSSDKQLHCQQQTACTAAAPGPCCGLEIAESWGTSERNRVAFAGTNTPARASGLPPTAN